MKISFIILCCVVVGTAAHAMHDRLQEDCAAKGKADCKWHHTDILCESHDCTFMCNDSTIALYMNKSTGTLKHTGYLKCSPAEGQQVSFGVLGIPQEKVEIGRYSVNISLDSADNMTLIINSLRDGFDNSDSPLHYHVKVIELSTESPGVTSAPPGSTSPAISQPIVSDSATRVSDCKAWKIVAIIGIVGIIILSIIIVIMLLQKKYNGNRDKYKDPENNYSESGEKQGKDFVDEHNTNDSMMEMMKVADGSNLTGSMQEDSSE